MRDTFLMIAYQAGVDAANRSASRAPCRSRVIMQMIGDKVLGAETGDGAPLLAAFSQGYQSVCDAAAAGVLARETVA